MITNNDIEFRTAEEIEVYQNGRLQEALKYLAEQSPFYKRMFRECGIDISAVSSIDCLPNLPFTEKKDLQLWNAEA